jgi:hypothetical protein
MGCFAQHGEGTVFFGSGESWFGRHFVLLRWERRIKGGLDRTRSTVEESIYGL